ncbi:hypothetical protein GGF50DRAFT_108829, partial [Schizophyllum commune]
MPDRSRSQNRARCSPTASRRTQHFRGHSRSRSPARGRRSPSKSPERESRSADLRRSVKLAKSPRIAKVLGIVNETSAERAAHFKDLGQQLDDAGRWITRSNWGYPSFSLIFEHHFELVNIESSYDRFILEKALATMLKLLPWFDLDEIAPDEDDTDEQAADKTWYRAVLCNRLDKVASMARSNDVSNFRSPIATYVKKSLPPIEACPAELAAAIADLRVTIDSEDKSVRGFYCRATGRALIPPQDLPRWLEDPDELMDRIRTRKHLLSPKHMPSFIYKNYTLDTTDPYMGAFEGDLIVLALKHLYLGPEAAKSDKKTNQGQSVVHKDMVVTREKLAYAVLMIKHALSSDTDWRGDIDGVKKAVLWRHTLQVLSPGLTMDLGVKDYTLYTNDEDNLGLDGDLRRAVIDDKLTWVEGLMDRLTERVFGCQRITEEERQRAEQSDVPSTAAQMTRNIAERILAKQKADADRQRQREQQQEEEVEVESRPASPHVGNRPPARRDDLSFSTPRPNWEDGSARRATGRDAHLSRSRPRRMLQPQQSSPTQSRAGGDTSPTAPSFSPLMATPSRRHRRLMRIRSPRPSPPHSPDKTQPPERTPQTPSPQHPEQHPSAERTSQGPPRDVEVEPRSDGNFAGPSGGKRKERAISPLCDNDLYTPQPPPKKKSRVKSATHASGQRRSTRTKH